VIAAVVVVQLSQAGVLAANYIFGLLRRPWRRRSKVKLWLGFSRGGVAKSSCGWVLAAAALLMQTEAGNG